MFYPDPTYAGMENVENAGPFTLFNPEQHSLVDLVNSLIKPDTGIALVGDTINLKYGILSNGDTSISFYDGSLGELGIGKGLFMSSGTANPPLSNTSASYSGSFAQTIGYTGSGESVDPELQAVAKDAFAGAGNITDATILEFTFEVTDPNVQSVQVNFVFGSEEYPNFVDSSFVDIGAIFVNGTNQALFNGNPEQPLSIIGQNLSVANFNQNQGAYKPTVPAKYADSGIKDVEWPIEFNAVSNLLSVVVAVEQGENTIKIGVSDTGDKILDSGLFVAGLQGVGYTVKDGTGIIIGDDASEPGKNPFGDFIYDLPYEVFGDPFTFWTQDGVQHIYGSKENPIDAKFDFSVFDIQVTAFNIDSGAKTNTVGVKTDDINQQYMHVHKMIFTDFAAAMDTWEGAPAWKTFSLLQTVFGQDPNSTLFTEWYLKALEPENYCKPMTHLADLFLDTYGLSDVGADLMAGYMYYVLTGNVADTATTNAMLGVYSGFGANTSTEILAFTADNFADTSAISELLVPLDMALL